MGQYVDFYCGNNNKELCKMVNPILIKNFGWISQKDYDDFYSIAAQVVWDCENKFNSNKVKSKKFKSYLSTCIFNKVKSQVTSMNRKKRMNQDDDGEFVHNVSIDTPYGDSDNLTIADTLKSDFDMEHALKEKNGEIYDEKIEKFLESLSITQREILEMLMKNISVSDIKSKLELSDKQYRDHMQSIRENKMVSVFSKKTKNIQKVNQEDIRMKKDYKNNDNDVMDIDTTDSYRTDKYPLGSLLDDKAMGYLDCNYISQREAFQWEEEQVNKFLSRVLNNQPIPEIVICEMVVDGEKKSFLVEGLQRLSYSEAFRENRIPVKAKGAEFVNVRYKKRVVDENGNVKFEVDTFNIIGKYYRDLPEFLQKRFDNFNITTTRFFNCTSEIIDYHMRNYNNHVAMTKSQYGITNVSNTTSKNIKNISKNHTFFKNNVNCSNKNRKRGALEEVVGRAIMAMYFIEDWKKDVIDVFKFLNENATDSQFDHLIDNLDRLSKVTTKSVQNMFNTTNGYIWIAVYDKFSLLGLDDSKFIEFMDKFKNNLHSKVINGKSYDIVNTRNTKDKNTIINKINMIVLVMCDYFNVKTEDVENKPTTQFVKEYVNQNITQEDIEFYEDCLNELTLNVDNNTKLLDKQNHPSLIALVAYACKKDIYMDEWFVDFFERNKDYIRNQKDNFLHMINDLENYINKTDKKSA